MRLSLESGLYTRAHAPDRRDLVTRPGGDDFGQTLLDAVAHADRVARAADQASEGLVAGTVSIHEALVAMEKANLTLQLGTTIRNKLLEAYREIMNAAA